MRAARFDVELRTDVSSTAGWNFIRAKKYDHDDRFLPLAFPHIISEDDQPAQAIARHPHLSYFAEIGNKFTHHAVPEAEGGHARFGGLGPKGGMRVQVCRSSADWSSVSLLSLARARGAEEEVSQGILKEHSIMNAYCQLIAEASHSVFIENQFFITSTGAGGTLSFGAKGTADFSLTCSQARDPSRTSSARLSSNASSLLLARGRSSRSSSCTLFSLGLRAKVLTKALRSIPAIPGFAGDLKGNSGTLCIMGATYNGICRGGNSIMEVIEKEGFNPHDYVSFYNLRSYDRINYDPERLKRMEEKSDIDFDHAQAALARCVDFGVFARRVRN